MSKWTNKKTGFIYEVIDDNALCATNTYEGSRLVVYKRVGESMTFVRDYKEFFEQFIPYEDSCING